jgi:magnesium-transporting ATPase (P-type)
LADDNFASIVTAIGEGRNVYEIIKKTIYFLLVCNLSEIVVMLFAQMAGWGIILTPVMLLTINMLGDGIPGINLAREMPAPRLMKNKPIDRNVGFMSGELLRLILRQTVACSVVVLIGFYFGKFIAMDSTVAPSAQVGQTIAFLLTGWTSIIHILHVRSSKSVFRTSLRNNKWLARSTAFMLVAFGLLVLTPVGQIFGLTQIGLAHWVMIFMLTPIPTAVRELGLYIDRLTIIRERRTRLRRLLAEKGWTRAGFKRALRTR